MIQRQQSLWLLLAAVCSFFSFQFPFYSGTVKPEIVDKAPFLEAGSHLGTLLLTAISIVLALITIFLFKNRKLQLRLAIAGAVLSILIIIIYFSQMSRFSGGTLALASVFVFLIPVGYILAARGIWKDEKLVKSLDKLR
jgi:DMSO/TMAO reductase YedYZ heme-binding membrane subunit